MDLAEFLAWDAPPNIRWQLVDGEPQAMAPPNRTHAVIQAELLRLIGNHLAERGSPCTAMGPAGVVPRVQADINFRVPDVAVTCTDVREEEHTLSDPVLLVEVLSPTNQSETWTNIWSYTTIPSVKEILVVDSVRIRAHLLRRDAEGNWPERALVIEDEMLELTSIDFRVPIAALYRRTRLARGTAASG
ncbi:MAG TPA: Uma2 family endonuclease [Acetobacteraceae bacterium]